MSRELRFLCSVRLKGKRWREFVRGSRRAGLILVRRKFSLKLNKKIMKHILSLAVGLLLGVAAAAQSGSIAGKVTETMNASGYTYVLLDSGTNKVWAAATRFAVKVGDTVTLGDAVPMSNFRSDTLKRDFALIYFASGVTVNGTNSGPAKLPQGHPPLGATASKSSASTGAVTEIKPLTGGKTVAQIYAESAALSGKTVKVRGKVVKYNANIMGKNWVHVVDGTGAAGSNDLLATSTSTAKVGDIVVVEGKVTLDKDFGAGYKYKLLLEEAKVTVE
jgi:hypothetical protein